MFCIGITLAGHLLDECGRGGDRHAVARRRSELIDRGAGVGLHAARYAVGLLQERCLALRTALRADPEAADNPMIAVERLFVTRVTYGIAILAEGDEAGVVAVGDERVVHVGHCEQRERNRVVFFAGDLHSDIQVLTSTAFLNHSANIVSIVLFPC